MAIRTERTEAAPFLGTPGAPRYRMSWETAMPYGFESKQHEGSSLYAERQGSHLLTSAERDAERARNREVLRAARATKRRALLERFRRDISSGETPTLAPTNQSASKKSSSTRPTSG